MQSRIMSYIILTVMVLALLVNVNNGLSQEWSKEQQMVWKNVEAYWAISAEENLEGYMAYFHEDYLGWNMNTPLPGGKDNVKKWMPHWWKNSSVIIYDIEPVGIAVFGDVAVAHYYYTMVVANDEGKERTMEGAWTDVLMKQGDKWVLIGDHGGNKDSN